MANRLDTGALLGHLPLFRNLDARQLALMARACQEVRVAQHGFAFQRGDPANGLYVVAVGTIKLAIPSPSGQKKVLEFFTAGQVFGEAVIFLDKPYMAHTDTEGGGHAGAPPIKRNLPGHDLETVLPDGEFI